MSWRQWQVALLLAGAAGCLFSVVLQYGWGITAGFWFDFLSDAAFVLVLTGCIMAAIGGRRQADPVADEPSGVRIVHGDGRVSECALVRDPQDKDGCAQWIAEPPPGTAFDPVADCLHVDYLPARTSLTVGGLELP